MYMLTLHDRVSVSVDTNNENLDPTTQTPIKIESDHVPIYEFIDSLRMLADTVELTLQGLETPDLQVVTFDS